MGEKMNPKNNEREEIQSKTMLIDQVENIDEILAQLNRKHPDDENTGIKKMKPPRMFYIIAGLVTLLLAALTAYFLR